MKKIKINIFSLPFLLLLISGCDNGSPADSSDRMSVIGGKASIVLPEGYVKMPESLLEIKYPQKAQRPQEAWYLESEGGKVSIAFSVTGSAISDAQVPQFAGMMKEQLKAFTPEIVNVKIEGRKMSRLEMTTPAADGNIFNVMQLSSFNGKMMISTFNVTEDLKDKYSEQGKKALSSLRY